MARNLVPRVPILLALSGFNDEELHTLVADIKAAAATSTMVQGNPAMVTSVASLVAKDASLTTSNTTVANDKLKLHTDVAAEAVVRTAVVGEARTFATLVTDNALTPADVHSAGLTARDVTIAKLLPLPPSSIDQKVPKTGHGEIVVSAHETGPVKHQYIAEQSVDGITWTPLGLGRGKTRTLTGASGTKIWVHFATVRGELQSAWSTAQLVTIP